MNAFINLFVYGFKNNSLKSLSILNDFQAYRKQLLIKCYRYNLLKYIKYEREWKKIRSSCQNINIYGLSFIALGETVVRLGNMVRNFRECGGDTLNLVLPIFSDQYTGKIFNKKVLDIFDENIKFVTETNIDFWEYVVRNHVGELNIQEFNKYYYRPAGVVSVGLGHPVVPFKKCDVEAATERMKAMGILGEFICIHARDSKVKIDTFNQNSAYESSCRECDINTFRSACLYMEGEWSIRSVRMGKYEATSCSIPGVIDYAGKYWDGFMDFYLLSKCKFVIGSPSGLTSIAGFFGRPVLMTNDCTLCFGYESCPITGQDMYLPKKFWSEKEGRYLNLYESLEIGNKSEAYASNYIRLGVTLVNNTEEEILDAAMEMNDRLDGRWVETEEEIRCMEKYQRIVNLWKGRHPYVHARRRARWRGYDVSPYRISFHYLKKNLYLIDVDLDLL